jgi:putative RNA 2'-phosphotransferase
MMESMRSDEADERTGKPAASQFSTNEGNESGEGARPDYTAVSRVLSKALRHEPEFLGITLDARGWVSVDEVLAALSSAQRRRESPKRLRTLPPVTRELLLEVIRTNDKQRFTLSEDGARIRAAQGHSIGVELGYPSAEPPAVLYHGTSRDRIDSILAQGLVPGSRDSVHLSDNTDTAARVGARHGTPVVLVVRAAAMHAAGLSFQRADNGVWLTASVPPDYIDAPKSALKAAPRRT